jgi:hypothetical protein
MIAVIGGGLVATAAPAGAAIDRVYRHVVVNGSTRYELHVDHHNNGVNHARVYRYDNLTGSYIATDVDTQSYDFACFVLQPAMNGANPKVHIVPALQFDDQSCAGPNTWVSGYCGPWNVGVMNHQYIGLDHTNNRLCPWNFGTGNMAFGPNAPLRNVAWNFDHFELLAA